MSTPDQPTPPTGWGDAPRPPAPEPGQYGQGQYGQGQYGQPRYGAPGPQGAPATPPGSPYPPSPYGPAAVKPGIVPLRPLSLGEVYDGAFGAVRHNPAVVLGLVTLVVAVATLLATLLAQLAVPWLTGLFGDVTGEPGMELLVGPDVAMLAQLMAVSGALSLTLLVAQPIAEGVVTVSVSQSVIGRKLSPGEVWARLRPRLGLLVGWMVLRTIGVAVGFTVVLVAAVLLVAGVANVTDSAALAVVLGLLIALGVVALVLWLTVRLVLVVPALVLEGAGLGSTIARAWRLTRGNFWRVLGTYLLASIIAGFVGQIVGYPLSLAGMAIDGGDTLGWGFLLATIVASVVSTLVVIVFVSGVVALVYTDVRMRREGLDVTLARAAARAAQTPAP
ncbi:glycerophosphoryl diester phosphodiesterase family protein [Isoptericola jiangsuensis]|uniref:Glycerophosphoryl diester phosphodiesterase family protein n=1 Tax=Isoptericola jiangsuensis TaxID=548579 RepID=A0A2A9EZ50_9MICO|nr:glycerophosphoryl diester phosphodiesterase membrane domain-containing protein [Isoptericola jiangsuensis]PFG44033.1 glycerophosphoryl diester phosphodiesterase family protein [Isoptericola jiangsuensis]